jgi:hypothetical protein
VPSTVTCASLIASSRADWVRGEARLISSASSTCVKIGPLWNEKEPWPGSSTSEPMMSLGSRSGVNCTRAKLTWNTRAIALASVVLPTPGTSSTST